MINISKVNPGTSDAMSKSPSSSLQQEVVPDSEKGIQLMQSNFHFNVNESAFSALTWLSILIFLFVICFIFYHGYAPLNVHTYFWGLLIPVSYILLRNYCRFLNIGSSITRGGSRLSDVLGFIFVEEICVTYLAFVGIMGFWRLYSGWDYGNIFEERIFGKSQFVEDYFLIPMLAYQSWILLFAILHKEFRTVDSLIHHVCAIGVTLCCFVRK